MAVAAATSSSSTSSTLVAVEAPRETIAIDLTDPGGCGLGADGFLQDHQLASINFDFGEAAFSPDAGGGLTTRLDDSCRRRLRGKQPALPRGTRGHGAGGDSKSNPLSGS